VDRNLPGSTHVFLAPTAGVAQAATDSDQIVAWSLGAWRVLDHASRGNAFPGPVLLLAPFLAFCAEDQFGGRASRAQVRWLRRWFQRKPAEALDDFRQRAGLGQRVHGALGKADRQEALGPHPRQPSLQASQSPYASADLLEGLDTLEESPSPGLLKFVAQGLPAHWRALVGGGDPLLDGKAVCRAIPGCKLIPDATHEPATLLAAIKGPLDAL